MQPLQYGLDVACRGARAGGATEVRFYGSARAQAKMDSSPATEADHASNRGITEQLSEAFAAGAILSEESRDSSERIAPERVWIVDPPDGIKEFLARNGEFSVMVGLAVEREAVLGAVYLPALDILYWAGACVEGPEGRQALRCKSADSAELRLVGSRSHPDPLLDRTREAMGITDVVPCGSAGVKCARDLHIHPVVYLKERDTCAPEVILRDARGSMFGCRGEPPRYNKRNPTQPHGILACASSTSDGVLAAVRPLHEQSLAVGAE